MLTHSDRKGKEGWLNQRLACPSKSFQEKFKNFFQSSWRVSFVKFQLPHSPRRKRKFQQPSFFHCLNSHLPQDFPPFPIVSPFFPPMKTFFSSFPIGGCFLQSQQTSNVEKKDHNKQKASFTPGLNAAVRRIIHFFLSKRRTGGLLPYKNTSSFPSFLPFKPPVLIHVPGTGLPDPLTEQQKRCFHKARILLQQELSGSPFFLSTVGATHP